MTTRNFTAKCIEPNKPDPEVLHEVFFEILASNGEWFTKCEVVRAECPMSAIELMRSIYK